MISFADEMRPVRFLLEVSKPELLLKEHGIDHTVVIFGTARISPDMERLDASVKTAQLAIMEARIPDDDDAGRAERDQSRTPVSMPSSLCTLSTHASLRTWCVSSQVVKIAHNYILLPVRARDYGSCTTGVPMHLALNPCHGLTISFYPVSSTP